MSDACRHGFFVRVRGFGAALFGAPGAVLAVVAVFAVGGCAQVSGPVAGGSFRDCDDCPEMVVVPAGSFDMGSPETDPERDDDESPLHRVTIAKALAVGRYEVTFAEWDACIAAGGCEYDRLQVDEGWGRGSRPVVKVSWHDARSFAAWLSAVTGRGYRLPSEAEWEYFSRAGTVTARPWGQYLGDNLANCVGCGSVFDDSRSAPVGSFGANRFGLYETLANVWEWVEDCWNDSYAGAPPDGSAWTTGDCRNRVIRGGSSFTYANHVRSPERERLVAVNRGYGVGFRVVLTLDP